MSNTVSTQADMPDQEFKVLTSGPAIAWPTLILFFVCMTAFFSVVYAAVTDVIPLWVGSIINGVVVYFLFSIVHDSSHGSISSNKKVNDFFGQVGMLFFGPIATLELARWIHMQHHRFTNDPEKDPDDFGHKMDLLAPLRWMNFDYFYTSYFLKHAGPMRKKMLPRLILQITFVVVATVGGFLLGYGWEVVMLWLVPTRISSALFVAMFVYLPHAPFTHTAAEDEYRASSLRKGSEWLLTPLMAYQNYHLVHHLYPRAPFYRMLKIWKAKETFHDSHNPYIVGTFAVSEANNA